MMRRRTDEGLIWVDGLGYEGLVYQYINKADNDKPYVGCTAREKTRKESWRNWSNAYAGKKIADARKESEPKDWEYKVLERLYSEDLVELEQELERREAFYIKELDACDNGYNSNRGGSGHTGMEFSDETKQLISENHRRYQSTDTRKKLSDALKGHKVKEATRKKISEGNRGKKRTDEQRAAQSERQKGVEPVAASKAAKEWVEKNGGYWKGKQLPDEMRANMKTAQQKRGINVVAHFPDDHTETYPTLLDAEKATGVKVGSIHNNLKHSSPDFKTATGFWFERKEDSDGVTTAAN